LCGFFNFKTQEKFFMSSSLSKVIGMGMALTLTAACGGHKQESSMKFDDQTAKTLSVYEAKNELTKDQIRKICSLSNLNIFIGNAEPIGEIMFAENADQSFKEKLTLKTQRNSQRLNEATLRAAEAFEESLSRTDCTEIAGTSNATTTLLSIVDGPNLQSAKDSTIVVVRYAWRDGK